MMSVDVFPALQALAAGDVIAYPTETVYGLGADPGNPVAMERLLKLKGRSHAKGFILLIQDRQDLLKVAQEPSQAAQAIMERFWPGPLTIVLPARPGLSRWITGGRDSVAVRHSSSPLVMALLKGWGGPLVSTSANPSGHPPSRDEAVVRELWRDQIRVILQAPPMAPSLPSTVVAVEAGAIRVLRQGAVNVATLAQAFPQWKMIVPET